MIQNRMTALKEGCAKTCFHEENHAKVVYKGANEALSDHVNLHEYSGNLIFSQKNENVGPFFQIPLMSMGFTINLHEHSGNLIFFTKK